MQRKQQCRDGQQQAHRPAAADVFLERLLPVAQRAEAKEDRVVRQHGRPGDGARGGVRPEGGYHEKLWHERQRHEHNRRSGEVTNQAGTGFQFSLRAIQATTAKPATSQTRQ